MKLSSKTPAKLTEESKALFLSLAQDADNWSGMPMIYVTPQQRGNLTALKRAKLLTTYTNKGVAFARFTEAGVILAGELGVDLREYYTTSV